MAVMVVCLRSNGDATAVRAGSQQQEQPTQHSGKTAETARMAERPLAFPTLAIGRLLHAGLWAGLISQRRGLGRDVARDES